MKRVLDLLLICGIIILSSVSVAQGSSDPEPIHYFMQLDTKDAISVNCDQRFGDSLPTFVVNEQTVTVVCSPTTIVYVPFMAKDQYGQR